MATPQHFKSKRLTLVIQGDKASLEGEDERRFLRKMKKVLPLLENFFWGKGMFSLNLARGGIKKLELGLTLCNGTKIRHLNRTYRQKDKATDVLSFPLQDTLRDLGSKRKGKKKGQKEFLGTDGFLLLGDIVIGVPVARRQAKSFGITLPEEMIHLFIHGLLHLCGFDHEISPEEEEIMTKYEDKWVKAALKLLNP